MHRAAAWFSGISYGIFLVHQALGRLIMMWLQQALRVGSGLQTLARLANSVLLGWLVTRYVDRPTLFVASLAHYVPWPRRAYQRRVASTARQAVRMLAPVTVWGTPIEARVVLRRDREHLLDLLRALPPEAWDRPTVCEQWRVCDVVAHVLGDDLGRLSRTRDGHDDGDRPRDGEPPAAFLARLNQRWVDACAGRSTAVLLEQLAATTPAVLAFWENLDLSGVGEAVTWAGPQPAPRWLDCARDFTEYWTQQRQIRDAVGIPHHDDLGIDHIALDTFLRAVPHTLRYLDPSPGATATVVVTGPAGGRWNWAHSEDGWTPTEKSPPQATATATVDQETLWRLCTRGIDPTTARTRAHTVGPPQITDALTALVLIIH